MDITARIAVVLQRSSDLTWAHTHKIKFTTLHYVHCLCLYSEKSISTQIVMYSVGAVDSTSASSTSTSLAQDAWTHCPHCFSTMLSFVRGSVRTLTSPPSLSSPIWGDRNGDWMLWHRKPICHRGNWARRERSRGINRDTAMVCQSCCLLEPLDMKSEDR